MSSAPARRAAEGRAPDLVAAYKAILKRILDNRPSGARQRLAAALGTKPSFVSQITNPAYAVPVPAQHIETILAVCHATPAERASFLEAYARAHPRRPVLAARPAMRQLVLAVPELGDARRNRAFDAAVEEHARRLAELIDTLG